LKLAAASTNQDWEMHPSAERWVEISPGCPTCEAQPSCWLISIKGSLSKTDNNLVSRTLAM